MPDINIDQVLVSLHKCESLHALELILEGLPNQDLEDIGWELLPGLYKHLEVYPRARLLWDVIIDKCNASEICLSLNQILHSDLTLQSPRPLFQAYNQIFNRLLKKPSRLVSIKRDLFRNLKSLLHTESCENKILIKELCMFSGQYLSDPLATELALDLIPYTDYDSYFVRMVAQSLSLKDVISKCLSMKHEAIPSGLCHILLFHIDQGKGVVQQDDLAGLGSTFILLCIVSTRRNRIRVLYDLVNMILPILTSWGWLCEDLTDILLLMDQLIPAAAFHSKISRLPFRILSTICSDQSLIHLAESSKLSRPHLASISLRVLKDRLQSDCRDVLVSALRSAVSDIISEYDPDLTFQSSDLAVELAYLDVISSSFNIAIYLALSRRIFVDRRVVRSCMERFSLLLNRLEAESHHAPDSHRLHSGRMQIRLVESDQQL